MNGVANTILLSLGANLGDRLESLRGASLLLESEVFNIGSMRASSVYETEPVGYIDQPLFLNIALLGETLLSPDDALAACNSIENRLGRRGRLRWREREIDIDILLYGNMIIQKGDLRVPHPRMIERRFVLEPAAEIAPEYKYPVTGQTLRELAENCQDNSGARLFAKLFG